MKLPIVRDLRSVYIFPSQCGQQSFGGGKDDPTSASSFLLLAQSKGNRGGNSGFLSILQCCTSVKIRSNGKEQ